MATAHYLLQKKTKSLGTIGTEATVCDAAQMMAEKDVGALMVIADNEVIGMITERDFVKKVMVQKRPPETTLVKDVMESHVISVEPEQTVDACMALMTEHHIRHLPVMKNGQLMGIISIRDVVGHVVSEQEFMIMQLEDYIMACPTHLGSALPPVGTR